MLHLIYYKSLRFFIKSEPNVYVSIITGNVNVKVNFNFNVSFKVKAKVSAECRMIYIYIYIYIYNNKKNIAS